MLCPHTVFMCFVWISEQTAIISLHNTDCFLQLRRQCVYCAVVFKVMLSLKSAPKNQAMTQSMLKLAFPCKPFPTYVTGISEITNTAFNSVCHLFRSGRTRCELTFSKRILVRVIRCNEMSLNLNDKPLSLADTVLRTNS